VLSSTVGALSEIKTQHNIELVFPSLHSKEEETNHKIYQQSSTPGIYYTHVVTKIALFFFHSHKHKETLYLFW